MIDRRTLIQSGIALKAASLTGLAWPLAGRAGAATLELERLIFDPRFDDAYAVAERATAHGIGRTPVADDLMSLWYDELDPLWKRAPQPLAGVTLKEALFVLETLALDRQMRVVFRGEHRPVEHGRVRHTFAGPAALVEPLAALSPDADWHAALAQALASCPLGTPEPARAELVTAASGLTLRDETLHSWIIAPRAAVAVTIPS